MQRTVRHIEPWSALKIALVFFTALFLIVCVASGLLWSGARASGQLANVESFITSVGGFGNCEPVGGGSAAPTTTTTVTVSGTDANQIDPSRKVAGSDSSISTQPGATTTVPVGDANQDCRAGEKLVGQFKFDDVRIFQAFTFGGVVLVIAGTGAVVVLVLLFNLIGDLTGGVRLTVVEDEPDDRRRPDPGSPPSHRRG